MLSQMMMNQSINVLFCCFFFFKLQGVWNRIWAWTNRRPLNCNKSRSNRIIRRVIPAARRAAAVRAVVALQVRVPVAALPEALPIVRPLRRQKRKPRWPSSARSQITAAGRRKRGSTRIQSTKCIRRTDFPTRTLRYLPSRAD